MAEVKKLDIPSALYDYVLFYECAKKDWLDYSKKSSVKGDGSLIDAIKWDSTYSYDPRDKGGKTLFGVTEYSWENIAGLKGFDKDLNSMGQNGWFETMKYYWSPYSQAEKAANYACGITMFQMSWGGFSKEAQNRTLKTLKENADIKDYNFTTKGGLYAKIADATHAYKDPMIAYDYLRKELARYYYNISAPGNTNKVFRMGWLTRSVLSLTPYGLYMPTTFGYEAGNLKYESPLEDWETVSKNWVSGNKSGYVKIIDWGVSPEAIEKMSENAYNYTSDSGAYSSNSNSSSGAYGGNGGVHQLGNYTNAPDANIIHKQSQSREEVLNTLMGGSYMPNMVKKCNELITTDKKKGIKTKSEK